MELKKGVHACIVEQRESYIAVSTVNIIGNALSHDLFVKVGDEMELYHWIRPFLFRCIHITLMAIRTDQKRNWILVAIYVSFSQDIMSKFTVQWV